MIDEDKIKLMSKLAIYEKKYGKMDNKLDGYYKGDYIYIHNWWTRGSVLIASCILAGFLILHKTYVEKINVIKMDYQGEAIRMGVLFIGLIVVYSIMGTYVYGKQYDKAQKRLSRYFTMLKQLNDYSKQERQLKEATEDHYGTSLSNQRSDDRLL